MQRLRIEGEKRINGEILSAGSKEQRTAAAFGLCAFKGRSDIT